MVNRMVLPLTAALGCWFGLACGEAVPVGQQVPSASQKPALNGDPVDYCSGGDDFNPVVDWEGYVENGGVKIAAERIRIRAPSGANAGYVVFGSGPALPEATDPSEPYPCASQTEFWLSGHAYKIIDSDVTERRMRFRISMSEPFEDWCALQTPVGDGSAEQPTLPDSCKLLLQCYQCGCDAESCYGLKSDEPLYAFRDGSYARFDIMLQDATADGSVQGLVPDISSSISGPIERVRLYAVKK